MLNIAVNTDTNANKIEDRKLRIIDQIVTAKLVAKEIAKFIYKALKDADFTMYS